MSYITRIGSFVVAHPGEPSREERRPITDGNGRTLLTLRPGDTFRGSKRDGIARRDEQRRAMALAEATGEPVAIVDGVYTNALAKHTTWQVLRAGAPGESHRRGWLFRNWDGGRTYKTWAEVVWALTPGRVHAAALADEMNGTVEFTGDVEIVVNAGPHHHVTVTWDSPGWYYNAYNADHEMTREGAVHATVADLRAFIASL